MRLVALSILICSPNMSFIARLVSYNSGHLEKLDLDHGFFLHGVRVLVRGYLPVRFDFPSSINFEDEIGFPKFGVYNPYNGSPQKVQSDTIGFYGLYPRPYLELFPRYRLRHVQRRYICLPLLSFAPRRMGSPGTIFIKFCMIVHGWLGYKMA